MNAEDGFFGGLAGRKLAIVGLGLMGGSLALALRGRCQRLLGVDLDERTLELAGQSRVFDRISTDPVEILPLADLIILAVPVAKIIAYLERLPEVHPGSAVVLDLGSTKRVVLESMQALPERFDPLGGHPMCGKETSSFKNADPALYQHTPFIFTPLPRTTAGARQLAEEIACAVGAQPLWLDADRHDRWVACTSHLPYLLANALAASIPQEAASLVGPGFRSTARLAGSSVEMMRDILQTNQNSVLNALQQVRGRLDTLCALLESSQWDKLEATLADGKIQYERLVK